MAAPKRIAEGFADVTDGDTDILRAPNVALISRIGCYSIHVAIDASRPNRQNYGNMIKALKFASIPVADQDRALHFWTESCGLEVATNQPMGPSRRWIELSIHNGSTRIVLFTPPGHEDRIGTFTGLSFECDDVEKTYAELSSRGVTFTQPPRKEEWGTSAIFVDPDGNGFVLSSR